MKVEKDVVVSSGLKAFNFEEFDCDGFGAKLTIPNLLRVTGQQWVGIRSALNFFGVIFINAPPLEKSEFWRVVQKIGKPYRHPFYIGVSSKYPEILELDSDCYGFQGTDWHTDVTFADPYPAVSILYCHIPAHRGGQTQWISTIDLLKNMKESSKSVLRSINVLHDSAAVFENRHPDPIFQLPPKPWPRAWKPLVMLDAVSGQESLMFNPLYGSKNDNLSDEEFDNTQHDILSCIRRCNIKRSITWKKPGTIAIWDNRITMHRVLPHEGRRVMRRLNVF